MNVDEIRNIIIEEIENISGQKIEDSTINIFFRNNYIDSLSIMNLIVFLEQKFGIEIELFFDDRESVDSIDALAQIIVEKLEKKSAG